MNTQNTHWKKWNNKNQMNNLNQPGVYFLAYTAKNIENERFSMIKEIIYIGMTISQKGIKGRLYQFERAIRGIKNIHGGGDRVKYWMSKMNISETSFFNNLFLSVRLYPISNLSSEPDILRKKGECVKYEYISFAEYYERHSRLPQFNDRKKSPKK